MKVHLLLPCRSGSMRLDTAMWMAQLASSGLIGAISSEAGCAHVELVRAELLDTFLSGPHEAALFVDDDISSIEGPALVKAMIDVDLPVVAMTYLKRDENVLLMGAMPGEAPFERNGQRAIKIKHTGLGCTLIRRFVFEHLKAAFPELQHRAQKTDGSVFNPFVPMVENSEYWGDDLSFFHRVRLAGMPVHTLLDRAVSHCGRSHAVRGP